MPPLQCPAGVAYSPGRVAIAAWLPLTESCLFAKSTSSSVHELQKFSSIPRELDTAAYNQGVWLAHHVSPCEPSLTPFSSFSVDSAQPRFFLYHPQPGLRSVSIGLFP